MHLLHRIVQVVALVEGTPTVSALVQLLFKVHCRYDNLQITFFPNALELLQPVSSSHMLVHA